MYGLIMLLAALVMLAFGERLVKLRALSVEVFYRLVFWAAVGALVGARTYHVVHLWTYYRQNIEFIPQIWLGGMGIWGALFGGVLGAGIGARMLWGKKVWFANFASYLEISAVVLPIGQAFGRLGNYFNYELFGYPTNLPWGIYIPYNFRPAGFEFYQFFHPLFLYEGLLTLLLFLVLVSLFRKKYVLKRATSTPNLYIIYLFSYSVIRFFLEFLRFESWRIGNFAVAQVISLFIIIVCCLGVITSRIKQKESF
jgi:phosphatidylglycerol---prolipoprotein diacylglyceryl transferase